MGVNGEDLQLHAVHKKADKSHENPYKSRVLRLNVLQTQRFI